MDSLIETETYTTSVVISDRGKVSSAKSTGNHLNNSDEALCPCPKCEGTILETGRVCL